MSGEPCPKKSQNPDQKGSDPAEQQQLRSLLKFVDDGGSQFSWEKLNDSILDELREGGNTDSVAK